MQISINDFKKVIEIAPTLTNDGINTPFLIKSSMNISLEEAKEEFKRKRESLFSHFGEFKICCEWLSKFKKVKTPQYSSYYLKHVVEKLAGKYVSNGVLIAAALYLNLPIKFNDGSQNVDIAISKKCPYLKKAGNVA